LVLKASLKLRSSRSSKHGPSAPANLTAGG
jgi:hypothetical protein